MLDWNDSFMPWPNNSSLPQTRKLGVGLYAAAGGTSDGIIVVPVYEMPYMI
jgi:hypothetical protein